MDPNYLMLSLLFGVIGVAMFWYGKKANRLPHVAAGIALMAFPYFITNVILLTSVGVIISIAPFVMPQPR
jgi:hypothetical protein